MNASITKSELFTAYNKARSEARRAGDSKLIERLNKALGILQSKAYYNGGDRVIYFPTVSACGCKDWQYRHAAKRAYTGPCKHMVAEQMLTAAMIARPLNITNELEALIEMRENAEV